MRKIVPRTDRSRSASHNVLTINIRKYMEEKEEKGFDYQSCENVEELRNKVQELLEEVADKELLVDAYRKEAEQYKTWWLNKTERIKKMKEDIEDIKKITNKIIERW